MKKIFKGVNKLVIDAFSHLSNSRHSLHHRMFTGLIFMAVGVSVSMFFGELGTTIRFFADGIGYGLHGAGCTPFLEYFISLVAKES